MESKPIKAEIARGSASGSESCRRATALAGDSAVSSHRAPGGGQLPARYRK